MDFNQAVVQCLRVNYAGFRGRAPRSEYWWFQLFSWLVISAAAIIGGMLAGAGALGLPSLATLALFLPDLAVSVRRLHDANHSGWWLLLKLVPLLGSLILFIFYIQRGTPGPNPYGPDPLGPADGAGPAGASSSGSSFGSLFGQAENA